MLLRSPRRHCVGDRRRRPSRRAGSLPSERLRPSAAPSDSITPRVGRNRVAFFDQQDVAGHEIRGGNAPSLPSRMTVASAADIARSAATAARRGIPAT